jgi:hypothetical protein
MKLLVITERKRGIRIFIPDSNNTFLTSFMELIQERLKEGWYEDRFAEQAIQLLYRYSGCAHSEELLKDVTRFLERRRRYEYEEWEIVVTEN